MVTRSNGRRALWLSAAILLGLALGVQAERGWVANRGGMTVNIFDTVTDTETVAAGSPVTVGAGPIDIASDQPDAAGPQQLFVANSAAMPGSVSVIGALSTPASVSNTITGGGIFGDLTMPMGIARVQAGAIGPAMVVVDRKATTGIEGAGVSTIRFIDISTHAVLHSFREADPATRYGDVAFTSNGRLWVVDEGAPGVSGGVTVVRFNTALPGPPFAHMGDTALRFSGFGEFADFIRDPAATATFLKKPRRIATNGTTRVVVVDGDSSNVTILDANYIADSPTTALLANVVLPGGFLGNDVEIVGGFAYVTTTGTLVGDVKVVQIDLATNTIAATQTLGVAGAVAGLGATSDGMKLYVGAGTSGSGAIRSLDISPPGDFTMASVAVGPFMGGSFPFAFYSSIINPGPGPLPGVVTGISTPHEDCGLLGIEVVLVLLGVGVWRRRRRCV